MDHLTLFSATAIALYAAHHVGDYWVQTDHQARHKGTNPVQCLAHVLTYVATQAACLLLLIPFGAHLRVWPTLAGLALSGVTHYAADRREHGLMLKLARHLPGKSAFLTLGVPRPLTTRDAEGHTVPIDGPSLGTGAWALDQAWHIFFGVFLTALVVAL